MLTASNIQSVKAQVATWKSEGKRIAFVPTMGNLHAGHLSLIEAARKQADVVIVSIFVNPTQFGPNEDFDKYPRTIKEDAMQLVKHRVDMVFFPNTEEMYPRGVEHATKVTVPWLSDILCGATRYGHFSGVATVVVKLFNIVTPDIAFFGNKDYQQLLVIKQMVEDLNLTIEVIGLPVIREKDGLALSSRNAFLTPDERRLASRLYTTMVEVRNDVWNDLPLRRAEKNAVKKLKDSGFEVEYVSINRCDTLEEASENDNNRIVLVAAHLGDVRLIDNLFIDT